MWKGIAHEAQKQTKKEQDQKDCNGQLSPQLRFYPGYKTRSERINSKLK